MIVKVPIYVEVDHSPTSETTQKLVQLLSKKLSTVIRRDSVKSYFSQYDAQYLSETFGELKVLTREKALEHLRKTK